MAAELVLRPKAKSQKSPISSPPSNYYLPSSFCSLSLSLWQLFSMFSAPHRFLLERLLLGACLRDPDEEAKRMLVLSPCRGHTWQGPVWVWGLALRELTWGDWSCQFQGSCVVFLGCSWGILCSLRIMQQWWAFCWLCPIMIAFCWLCLILPLRTVSKRLHFLVILFSLRHSLYTAFWPQTFHLLYFLIPWSFLSVTCH